MRSFIFSLFVLFAIILSTASTDAKPKKFTIRKEDSQFEFSIYKWAVFKEEGRFKDFEGTIVYDPLNPAATTVDIKVYVASIDSRNEGRDNALKSSDFFDLANYPTLTFKSTQITQRGVDSLMVRGILTMKGKAKQVIIPIRVTGSNYLSEIGTMIGFETSFTVNREEYNIANNWAIIGKEATLHILIGASSKD